jgi:CRISPR-associated endonuclease Csn1
MRYRLALDVGTASLGIVALELDDAQRPIQVRHSAVHIFSEPLLPAKSGGVGEPKKAARRLARQQRRLIERRARRLRRIAHLAPLLSLDRKEVPSDDGQSIHRLRACAARERIELTDLLNVLLKLAKRRGYAGGFKVRKEGEEGVVQSGIGALQSQIDNSDAKTLADLLNARFGGPRAQARRSLKLKTLGWYAHREMLEDEFERIWAQQTQHHPVLNGEASAYSVRGSIETLPVKQHFKEAIFYQRPLKSVAGMVGQCALEPTLPRAPAAQPAAQAFRIEKQLADLRWGMGRAQKALSPAQREHIRALLLDPAKLTKDGQLSFSNIYKSLEKAGLRNEFPTQFNTDRFSRETLLGDRTAKAVANMGLHDAWRALDETTQVQVINFVADLGSPELVDQPHWHERLTKTERRKNAKTDRWESRTVPRHLPEAVVAFVNTWVESCRFDRLSKMDMDGGRAAYSVKALRRLCQVMREQGIDEHGARTALYKPAEPTGELLMQLAPATPTGNVVVDVALRVVRHGVNACLRAMESPPSQVIVELSRDMALGLAARGRKEADIDKHRKARSNAKKEIEKHRPERAASNNEIFRYLLWREQDSHCPYCPERIEYSEFLDGNATNVDHILPRTLTQVKRLRSHLVIAHRACNAAKGDNVPMVAFGHDQVRKSAIENCANILKKKRSHRKAGFLLAESYEAEKLNDDTLNDFTERQFAESSWIAKQTAQWMRNICTDVSVSRGELTAQLRRAWKLETVIAQVRLETKVDPDSDAGDNHMPLFDEEGAPITREEFERYRACWENHHGPEIAHTDRRLDKRIDHRHHLVDALVIGLTDRRLYMEMARGYKERMEQRAAGARHVKPWQTPQPPLRGLRDIALDLVRDVAVKHKPDRHAAGAFFKGMAYAKTHTERGNSRLLRNVDLVDLTDEKFSLEKARRGIEDIVSSHTREIVRAEFERRISAGQDVKSALTEPISDPRYRTSIRRVRIYQRLGRGYASGEDVVKVEMPGRPYGGDQSGQKFYMSDGYAYVALIASEAGHVMDAVSVRVADAPRFSMHRVARCIFRGDTVVDELGRRHVVHQILADGGIRTAPPIETRSWNQLGAEAGARSFGKTSVIHLKIE